MKGGGRWREERGGGAVRMGWDGMVGWGGGGDIMS